MQVTSLMKLQIPLRNDGNVLDVNLSKYVENVNAIPSSTLKFWAKTLPCQGANYSYLWVNKCILSSNSYVINA